VWANNDRTKFSRIFSNFHTYITLKRINYPRGTYHFTKLSCKILAVSGILFNILPVMNTERDKCGIYLLLDF